METKIFKKKSVITGTNCITGESEQLTFQDGTITHMAKTEEGLDNDWLIGPGLMDLQINGINGIDFNTPSLTKEDIVKVTHYLLSSGVTTFFPTVITNSDENILTLLQTIHNACMSDALVNDCIGGIHLEGPFISPEPGARGAHDAAYIKPPDWELFNRFQKAAGGKIKLVTLAPEWEGAEAFIRNCREQNILVAIGHSMAGTEQVNRAIKAGATLSTHLGNGVPLMLQRHPNIIWDQLAAGELYACIITDGIHLPDSFIKVVLKVKGNSAVIVSDATCFAGMPPGEYKSHIGGTVVLDAQKRVSLKGSPGILAGAAKSLLENVQTLLEHHIATLSDAWKLASVNVRNMLLKNDIAVPDTNDKVVFQMMGNSLQIKKVIKKGTLVFES